jgi:hypothetical protein
MFPPFPLGHRECWFCDLSIRLHDPTYFEFRVRDYGVQAAYSLLAIKTSFENEPSGKSAVLSKI